MLRALIRPSPHGPRIVTAIALAVLTASLGYSLSFVSAAPLGGGKGGKSPPPTGKTPPSSGKSSPSSSSSSSSSGNAFSRLFRSNPDKKKTKSKKQPTDNKPAIGNAAGALPNPLSDGRPSYPISTPAPISMFNQAYPLVQRAPPSSSSSSPSSSSSSPQGAVSRAGAPRAERPMSTIRQTGQRILARKREELRARYAKNKAEIQALSARLANLKSDQRSLVNKDRQLAQRQANIAAGPGVYFQGANPPVVAVQGQNQGVSPSSVSSSSPSSMSPPPRDYDRVPPQIVYSRLGPNPKD